MKERKVDSYKWLHRSLAGYYQAMELPTREPVPFTALREPLAATTLAVVTTAGVHLATDRPFDVERERLEPTWGDPTYRILPAHVTAGEVEISHLHYDSADASDDLDIVFPLPLLHKFQAEGRIGRVADQHYSFMGFQLDATELLEEHLPKVIASLQEEGVDAVVLTPA